jgi:uncharacterized membrane protein YozB (DUF420 family)
MSAPWQALAAVAWAVAGPPLIIYGALRIKSGQALRHAGLMTTWVVLEILVMFAFGSLISPTPRRLELAALPFFKIHLVFAVATLLGIAWQLLSRTIVQWRPVHRLTGPYVVLVWCLALLTGIYNFVFLYVFAP